MSGGVHLRLIDAKPAKPRNVYAGDPLECRCGSRATTEVRIGRTVKNGRVSAGQKQIRCADCGATVWG